MRQPGAAIHPHLRSAPDADDLHARLDDASYAVDTLPSLASSSSFQRNEGERVRARLKDRGDPVTREGVGTEFKTVSLAKKPVLQPNNNALRCLRKLAR